MAKFINVGTGGKFQERNTVQESAGAGDADKIPSLNEDGILADSIINASAASAADAVAKMNGDGYLEPEILNATATSAGAGDADKIVQLDAGGHLSDSVLNATVTSSVSKIVRLDGTGRLDTSVMPVGIAADTAILVTGEALSAGNFINIRDVSGTPTVFKADAANGYEAYGFVLSAFGNGVNALVYFEGTNTGATGITAGPVFLSNSVAGTATATPVTTAGHILQQIGFSTGAGVNFAYSKGVERV